MSRTLLRLLIPTLLLLAAQVSASPERSATATATLVNLQVAHSNELNTRARYEAYAERALGDGHTQVAATFRAIAAAETVHASAMARVIRGLGAEPSHVPVKPRVDDTAANLRRAIADEVYDREQMYAEFLEAANSAGMAEVVRTLTCVSGAEEGHAALLAEAARDLENGIERTVKYRVCTGCGATQELQSVRACTCCGDDHDEFLEVK